MKVISLGVGVQSSALYYMSSMGEIDRCDFAVFADTGGEKTKTLEYYEFMLEWQKQNNGIELHKAHYKNLLTDILSNEGERLASIPAFTLLGGKKGMLRRQCTSEYKIGQVNKKIREVLNYTPKQRLPQIEIWQGITLDEMTRMKVPSEKWKVYVYPFCGYMVWADGTAKRIDTVTMSRNDIFNWYKDKGLPVPEKSSCVFCPFQSDSNWLRLKQQVPTDFETAIKVDAKIRDSSKKGLDSDIYLHDSLKPLSDVNFDESQISVWGNCTDACDV